MFEKQRLVRHRTADSTNSLAVDLGHHGALHGTVVVADQQTGGRGRMGRCFISPPGGLYMSVLLRPELMPEQCRLMTLAAGVACSRVIDSHAGTDSLLKWPNDLYVGHKKLAGILTETAPYSFAQNNIPFIVIGIGLNVNSHPDDFPPSLRDRVTSLYHLCHQRFDLDRLMLAIVHELEGLVLTLKENREILLDSWQRHDYFLDRNIIWQGSDGVVLRGVGAGVQDDGRYRLRTSDGCVHLILAGSVRLQDDRHED